MFVLMIRTDNSKWQKLLNLIVIPETLAVCCRWWRGTKERVYHTARASHLTSSSSKVQPSKKKPSACGPGNVSPMVRSIKGLGQMWTKREY